MKITAIYPGTFDPITNGHVDIIKRASNIFSSVIVAIAENTTKTPRFSLQDRVEMVQRVCAQYSTVEVLPFKGLLVDFAKEKNAHVLIRVVRAVSDFDYEFQLAGMNRKLNPSLETIFLTPSEPNMFISSTLVREVAALKGDISAFVPKGVQEKF